MRLPLLALLLLLAAAVAWPVGAGAQAKVCAGHPKDPSVVCARDSAQSSTSATAPPTATARSPAS